MYWVLFEIVHLGGEVGGMYVCSYTKSGTFWKPILPHFDISSQPKLAETALLFCSVTDVPFLPKNGTTNQNW